ncbi:MAG TPA: response regulator [Sedimenticola sp.]|nr:response regulator [Sedimenticola sp.]
MSFQPHELSSKSFLIVDDFGDMRSMLRSMLQSIGVSRIEIVANGESAIQALESARYDIVLCDYNLGPGKNGQQVLEEARHRELIGLGSVFLMITAENTREKVMGAVEYEPDSYLTKPFTKDLLKARLVKLVVRKKNLEPVERAVRQRDIPKAIGLLERLIAERPRNLPELIKLKAELCFSAGQYEQAALVYEQVLAAREMPWARLGLGKVMFASGRLERARDMFEQLIRDHGQLTAAYDWLAKTLQALEQPEPAQRVLQQAVEISPKAILRQRALGELALRNGDPATAEKALSQAVRLGQNSVYRHPALYTGLARAQAAQGNGKAALKALGQLERAFKGSDEARLYAAMEEGMVRSRMGEEQAADACLDRARGLYRTLGSQPPAELTLELARTCGLLGDREGARELLRSAVSNNHTEEAFLKQVGDVIDELDMEMDAERFIGDIRREIVRLNNQGVELARQGSLEEAVTLFEKAVQRMPGNRVVNLNAARVLIMRMQERGVDSEQLGRTREYLERVRTVDPENPSLRRILGMYQGLLAGAG